MKKFRDVTLDVRNSVHDAIRQKKSKDEITKMLQDVSIGAKFRSRWAASTV